MLNYKKLISSFNINKQKPIIVAVSGGVDSMVLLNLLIKEDYIPIVVHFNHNTRETNKRDENLIIEYSKKFNLLYYIFSINVELGNFQSEARKLRYEKLKSIAKKHNTPYIATAHHLDDLAETILIKITRGSNLYGYSGIQPIYFEDDCIFIRPLLHVEKDLIIKYSIENKIPFYTDESNYYDTYLRNRYRHTVLPVLKQENPQLLKKVLQFHEQLSLTSSYIKQEAKKYIVNNSITLTIYKDLNIVLQKEILALLMENKKISFTYETIEKLRILLLNDKPNLSYDLEGKNVLIKAYNQVYITNKENPLMFKICLDKNVNVLPNMKKITFSLINNAKENETIKICYNKLSLPLWARTREPGDVLAFKYGRKKLKDYLIDLKIPKHLRDSLWLITDNDNNIIWVSQIYKNETLGDKKEIKIFIGENK